MDRTYDPGGSVNSEDRAVHELALKFAVSPNETFDSMNWHYNECSGTSGGCPCRNLPHATCGTIRLTSSECCGCYTPVQENAFLVQIVLTLGFLVFDFGAKVAEDFDKDGSGSLDKEELLSGLLGIGPS
eukprot:3607519-Rhodomonas_salina.1